MKEKMGKILKNYKKAFVPEKEYLHQNNSDVCAVVNKRIAETNCRRILSISPILFVLYIVNIILDSILPYIDLLYFESNRSFWFTLL